MRFRLLRTPARGGKLALSRGLAWVPVQIRDRYPRKPGLFVGILHIFGPVPTLGRKNIRWCPDCSNWFCHLPRQTTLAGTASAPSLLGGLDIYRGTNRALTQPDLLAAIPPETRAGKPAPRRVADIPGYPADFTNPDHPSRISRNPFLGL